MAVNKRELTQGYFTAEETIEIESLEGEIDSYLEENFSKEKYVLGNTASIPLPQGVPHLRVRQELERRFRNEEWRINFCCRPKRGTDTVELS